MNVKAVRKVVRKGTGESKRGLASEMLPTARNRGWQEGSVSAGQRGARTDSHAAPMARGRAAVAAAAQRAPAAPDKADDGGGNEQKCVCDEGCASCESTRFGPYRQWGSICIMHRGAWREGSCAPSASIRRSKKDIVPLANRIRGGPGHWAGRIGGLLLICEASAPAAIGGARASLFPA